MNLIQEIDFDKLVVPLLKEVGGAVTGWLNGAPQSEPAFVNRITEVLASRKKCRGVTYADAWIETDLYLLDRRGPSSTDLFGSDIAVTVEVIYPDQKLAKTAFIQVKLGDNQAATIERQQIHDAMVNSVTADRSFVFAIDRLRAGAMSLEGVTALSKTFPSGQASAQMSTSGWRPLTVWIYNWLSCFEGVPSDVDDPRSPERMLSKFRHLMVQPRHSEEEVLAQLDLPRGMPRAWVKYVIRVPRPRNAR